MRTLLLYYDDYHTPLDLLRQKLGSEVTILNVILNDPGKRKDTEPFNPGTWPVVTAEAVPRFCDEILVRAIKANGCYQDGYFLSAALSRPLLATICCEQLEATGARRLVHGLAGNDQLRFEMGVSTLNPQAQIVSVAALLGSQAARNHHGFTQSSNVWGSSIEAGYLSDPWQEPTPEVFQELAIESRSNALAESCVISFEQGRPVALNDTRMSLPTIISELRDKGRRFGVGCLDLIEDGYVGLKTRAIYESAAALALVTAHHDLERLVSTRLQNLFKPLVDKAWTELVYNGFWFDPQRAALESYIENVNEWVTGEVRLAYRPGSFVVSGRRSEFAVYDDSVATYRVGQDFGVNAISEIAAVKSVQMKRSFSRSRNPRFLARGNS